MNRADHRPVDDASLVAWLDGELSETEAQRVAALVIDDPAIARRAELLRAAQHELRAVLRGEQALPAAVRRSAPRRATPWLVAAALLVVLAIGLLARGGDEPESAVLVENQFLAVSVAPSRPEAPLFGAIRFALEGRSKTAVPCRIVARRGHEDDEALATRLFAEPAEHLGIPLVLDATVISPEGTRYSGIVRRSAGVFGTEPTTIDVALEDLLVGYGAPGLGAINPSLGMRETAEGFVADWQHQFRVLGDLDVGGAHGFVPEIPGEWRIEFTLRSFTPAADSRWIGFVEPLRFACAFRVAGVVGAWSEPVDGLRARLVASASSTRADRPLAIALQLENQSDRPRAYNTTGMTLAKIPQPYHMTLIEDGEDGEQRDDLGVITSARGSYLPQPVGTRRSIAVLSDFWRLDGAAALSRPGEHRLALRFHFEPSAWLDSDKALWMGRIETPALTIRVEAVR